MATKGMLMGTVFDVAPTPPPFSPDDLTGLNLWLDASDASSVTSSGDKVDQWNDKSGAGITGNFTPFDSNRPDYGLIGDRINGLNTVTFTQPGAPLATPVQALRGTGQGELGSNDGISWFAVVESDETQYQYITSTSTYITTTGTSGYTTYTTSTYTSTNPNTREFINKGYTASWESGFNQNQYFWFRTTGGLEQVQCNPASEDLDVHVLTAIVDGTVGPPADTVGYRDNTLGFGEPSTGTWDDRRINTSLTPWYIGARPNAGVESAVVAAFHGSIGEIICYNRAVTNSERLQVQTYLADKWGVTLAP